MELKEAIKARRSVRKFQSKEVDESVIMEIIELGQLAPSAGNLQPRDFVIVRKQNTKEKQQTTNSTEKTTPHSKAEDGNKSTKQEKQEKHPKKKSPQNSKKTDKA